MKCPINPCVKEFIEETKLMEHFLNDHEYTSVAVTLGWMLSKIQKELQRLESLHLDFDRFATVQVAGQIQLLKSILDHEYYK